MNVLGLNLYFHDSAAAVFSDGALLGALEEERWFRDDKHTRVFPSRSIGYCLGLLAGAGVDHVAVNMDPIRCLSDSSGLASLATHPSRWVSKHWRNYLDRRKACRDTHTQLRIQMRQMRLPEGFAYHLIAHHDTHAASAFFVSPFDEAAVLVIDANGEWPTTTLFKGEGTRLRRLDTVGLPHSLGGFYASITEHLGFRRNNDEFKVMGLSAFGDPERYREVMRRLVRPTDDRLFEIDRASFGYLEYKIVPGPAIETLLECPARRHGEPLTQQHKDIAASLQAHLEEVVVHIARGLHERTGDRRLCLAGGVALNCVMNTAIIERTGFDELFVQPAAYDAGGAIGAACWVRHQVLGRPRVHVLDRVDLGPAYADDEIGKVLRDGRLGYEEHSDIVGAVCDRLIAGEIVGWFQGRAEFGPRALGFRSILADPTLPGMQDHLNQRVKHREDFRPFAPAAPAEAFAEYFEAIGEDPFMTTICTVRPSFRDRLPAVTHVDGTARLQTVRRETSPLFHSLLCEFGRRRGLPILLNTSFNVNGEPMVLTPHDAIRSLFTTGIDTLAIGCFLVRKAGLTG